MVDWAEFERSCARVVTEVAMPHPAALVFDYVSTPARWHTWHPATAEVLDTPDRPLKKGETALEVIAMLGQRSKTLWTVVACDPPLRWEITCDSDMGVSHIIYTITPTAAGCLFKRTLEYRSKKWPYRWLDFNVLRWVLVAQSARALRNLRGVLDQLAAA
jgi:hypothetical protein